MFARFTQKINLSAMSTQMRFMATKSEMIGMKPVGTPVGPYIMGNIIKQGGGESGTWGFSSGQIAMNPESGDIVGPTCAAT